MQQDSFTLNTYAVMPAIGFGTWEIVPDGPAAEAVSTALKTGYRLIDTAKMYANEKGVGEGIAASRIPRDELFVTTKLWNGDQGYDKALAAIDGQLAKLGLDYVDLYLIHWPQTGTRLDSWRALQQIYKSGKAKAVGVSNYTIRHLEELLSQSELVPAVNQIEFHPYIYEQQKPVLEYCKDKGIRVMAYCPLSRGTHAGDAHVQAIADRYGKTPPQILLRWSVQHGAAPIPRSKNPDHIRENFTIFDFELSAEDMVTLDGLSDGRRITTDPETFE